MGPHFSYDDALVSQWSRKRHAVTDSEPDNKEKCREDDSPMGDGLQGRALYKSLPTTIRFLTVRKLKGLVPRCLRPYCGSLLQQTPQTLLQYNSGQHRRVLQMAPNLDLSQI